MVENGLKFGVFGVVCGGFKFFVVVFVCFDEVIEKVDCFRGFDFYMLGVFCVECYCVVEKSVCFICVG